MSRGVAVSAELVVGAVSALGSGVLIGLVAWGRERWRARQPAAVESANLAAVARARDELAEDNGLLRTQLADERRSHALDRAEWREERADMAAHIDRIEAKLRALLEELAELRTRQGLERPDAQVDALDVETVRSQRS